MPLYDLRCDNGHVFERMIPLANFDDLVFCTCTAPATRLISRPMFMVEDIGYTCPVTDRWIGSRREHSDNLARQGCRVLETGETQAAAQYRRAADAELDRKLDATVEKTIDSLPSDKKESLFNELTRFGATAEVVRK